MKKFEIVIGSPIDYDHIVAYIWFNGEQVCLVQKEDGVNQMKIEFMCDDGYTKIDLEDFIEALNCAKKELLR